MNIDVMVKLQDAEYRTLNRPRTGKEREEFLRRLSEGLDEMVRVQNGESVCND